MKENELCNLCLDYLSGACSAQEVKDFELHLSDCKQCQSELDDLRIVWEAIPADMENIQPPENLKKQVMDAVIASDENKQKTKNLKKQWSKKPIFIGMAAALFFFLMVGLMWDLLYNREQMTAIYPVEQSMSVSAAQINRLIPLKPLIFEDPRSYGIACIVDNKSNQQLVVYVFGAKATSGQQAYQVWLNNGDQRTSAGTFLVDDQGIGVLAMPIGSDNLTFETIDITLEPDDQGSHPRGEKAFGSI